MTDRPPDEGGRPSESEDPRRRPEDDRGDTLFVAEEDDGRRRERIRSERANWPLWEVFIRPRRGLSHGHVGSLHAPDAEMALQNARDVFTRRGEGVSIWVVPAADIRASSPTEKDRYFDPAADKAYRHPTFYELPDEVRQL